MKPPLMSRAQLKAIDARRVNSDAQVAAMFSRQPLGLLPNALPRFWVAVGVTDGALLLMHDRSKNPDGATGPQVCLATISADTLATLLASKSPVELKP